MPPRPRALLVVLTGECFGSQEQGQLDERARLRAHVDVESEAWAEAQVSTHYPSPHSPQPSGTRQPITRARPLAVAALFPPHFLALCSPPAWSTRYVHAASLVHCPGRRSTTSSSMDMLLAALDISSSSSTRLPFQFTLLQLSVRVVCVRVCESRPRVCAHEIGLLSSTAGRHVKRTCSAWAVLISTNSIFLNGVCDFVGHLHPKASISEPRSEARYVDS